MAMTITY